MVMFRGQEGDPRTAENSLVTLDMDSKRVQEEQGVALFDADGKPTEYLEHINELLGAMMAGMDATLAFVKFLADQDLLKPAQLSITFADGEKKRFEGLFTVNGEKLAELTGESLRTVHQNGYLQACTLINVSMGQVQRLIGLKNARLQAAD